MTEPSSEKNLSWKKSKMIEAPKSIQTEMSCDIEDTLKTFPRAWNLSFNKVSDCYAHSAVFTIVLIDKQYSLNLLFNEYTDLKGLYPYYDD